jgi:hypothetical protein
MIKNLACIGFTSPMAEEWRSFGPAEPLFPGVPVPLAS